MFHEFSNPVPVVTPLGDGYSLYVRDGGTWENDIWCVVLEDGGQVKHFRTDQIKIHSNATFDIQKDLRTTMDRINMKYSDVLRRLAESEIMDGIEDIVP